MATGESSEVSRTVGATQDAEVRGRGRFTFEEIEALCEEYGNVCLRCGDREALLTPDHVVPLSLGGSNLIENIQPLCGNCNSWKNAKAICYRPKPIPLG